MDKSVAENRKARFDYEIVESFESGLVLTGSEIKAVRAGKVNLSGSYGKFLYTEGNPELWLVGTHIGILEGDQTRSRKLLIHKAEINRLLGKTKEKGFTLVPLKLYLTRGHAKLEIGLGRGKKQFDKRESIKKRETDRNLKRRMK
jgi:SsrA-binding protein